MIDSYSEWEYSMDKQFVDPGQRTNGEWYAKLGTVSRGVQRMYVFAKLGEAVRIVKGMNVPVGVVMIAEVTVPGGSGYGREGLGRLGVDEVGITAREAVANGYVLGAANAMFTALTGLQCRSCDLWFETVIEAARKGMSADDMLAMAGCVTCDESVRALAQACGMTGRVG